VEALDGLIFPEHRFKYWFQLVCDTYQDPEMQQSLLQETSGKKGELLQKIQRIVLLMLGDIMTESKSAVGQDIGLYNRQFAQKWQPAFTRSFGKDGQRVLKMDLTALVTELQNIHKQISKGQLYQGPEVVSKYSEWLDKLDCDEFYQVKNYIEIPGQYEGGHLSQEPLSQKNVKIASVKKMCLVLGSIRRPKKITVHGSNEKDYHLLVKGGEDLRLDQRVEQLFGLMNRIFQEDPACENRDLNLKTFNVVPITNRLGTLEWVDNTEPLKALVAKEHKRLEGGRDLHESRAYAQRMTWLKKLPGNRGVQNPAQLHVGVLKLGEQEVTKSFEEHQAAFPRFLLRYALENLCLTSSAFLTIKTQFIKSIAVFSAASYLLGIGDRHLENFLVDTTDGEVFGIDFGIAFGSNVQLSIPELIPFRLTR
jgi:DNA-dependent protein kinase catalytic subunit